MDLDIRETEPGRKFTLVVRWSGRTARYSLTKEAEGPRTVWVLRDEATASEQQFRGIRRADKALGRAVQWVRDYEEAQQPS